MERYVEQTKLACLQLIDKLRGYALSSVRVAVVCYQDHPKIDTGVQAFGFANDGMSRYVLKTHDFSEPRLAAQFIGNLQREVGGGGDTAEAALCGLDEAVNTVNWRVDAQKIIIHSTDAPPHGDEYCKRKNILDNFPSGCPCGHKIESIAPKIRQKGINYNLLIIDEDSKDMLADMRRIFKQHMGDSFYNEAPLANADQILGHVLRSIQSSSVRAVESLREVSSRIPTVVTTARAHPVAMTSSMPTKKTD